MFFDMRSDHFRPPPNQLFQIVYSLSYPTATGCARVRGKGMDWERRRGAQSVIAGMLRVACLPQPFSGLNSSQHAADLNKTAFKAQLFIGPWCD